MSLAADVIGGPQVGLKPFRCEAEGLARAMTAVRPAEGRLWQAR
jgi:hypothetical protein